MEGQDFQVLWIYGPRDQVRRALQEIYEYVAPEYTNRYLTWRLPHEDPDDRWNLRRIPDLYLHSFGTYRRLATASTRCIACRSVEHDSQHCPRRIQELDAQRVPGICRKCNKKAHPKDQCPVRIMEDQVAEVMRRIQQRRPPGTTMDQIRQIFEQNFGPSDPTDMTRHQRHRLAMYFNDPAQILDMDPTEPQDPPEEDGPSENDGDKGA